MDLNEVLQIIENPDTEINLYFTKKLKNGYTSFSPGVGNGITSSLIDLLSQKVNEVMEEAFEEIPFNPTGYREGTIENCDYKYVGNYAEVIGSFENISVESIETEAENLSFYCLELQLEDSNIKFFRRVTKFKRLYSKGLIAAFNGNTLNKVDSKMLGMDGQIDLIDFNGEILILNHISLERIFRIDAQYESKAQESLYELRVANKIVNFDQFEEDCLGDKNIQKILTKIQNENIDLEHSLDNFENVIKTINLFELEIDYQRSPDEKIIYEEKEQLKGIIRLARDSYYQTIVNQAIGYDNKI